MDLIPVEPVAVCDVCGNDLVSCERCSDGFSNMELRTNSVHCDGHGKHYCIACVLDMKDEQI